MTQSYPSSSPSRDHTQEAPRSTPPRAPQLPPSLQRRHTSRLWLPRQHGAWGMLLIPLVIGAYVGGWSWHHPFIMISWWLGYLMFWAWGMWVKATSLTRKALMLIPLLTYAAFTGLFGLISLIVEPRLFMWVPLFAPLMMLAAWETLHGRERSLLSGIAATTAACLMVAVMASIASPRTASNTAHTVTGWAWVWLVTALTAGYFVLTVPYVKSMIRGRGNEQLIRGSVGAHVVVMLAVCAGAIMGYLPWFVPAVYVGLALRAIILPLAQARRVRAKRPLIRPRIVGVSEIVISLIVMAALLLASA